MLTAKRVDAKPLVARLTGEVVPVAYNLTIEPDIEKQSSAGSEVIDVRVLHAVDAIALNARAVVVVRASVDGRLASVDRLPKIEQIRLRADRRIPAGRHRIELTFSSPIDGSGASGLASGLFQPHVAALFEPSTARTMFPCFDEPQFRARFTLHVRAPVAWTIISNMPLRARHELDDGRAQSDFAPTPPMPVYLLTLDGSVYAHVDGFAGGVPIRVFVRPGQEAHARDILADAQRLVPFFEAFFGVPFPLPKLDIVVSPGGLQSALEGWGAITFYSEGDAFGAQFNGGAHGRRYAVEVLAHEIAHQWVGDLVTMRWWRDTFVAEAAAEFSQRRAVSSVFPELMSWLDDDRNVAYIMRSPVTRESRPGLTTINTDLEAEDDRAFNGATYQKGASVVEGWQATVGQREFHAALGRYLRRYAYGSATFEEFWNELGGAPAIAYGAAWLGQRGFPIVDVRSACRGGHELVQLAQSAFVLDPSVDAGYRAQRWAVPIAIRVGSEQRRVMLRSARSAERMRACGVVEIDPGSRPYYAIRYDATAYARFARNAALMDQRARERLLRDASLLHGAGSLPHGPYLELLAAARDPLDDDVWDDLAQQVQTMIESVRGAPEAGTLAVLAQRLLLPLAERGGRIDNEHPPFKVGYDADLALAALGDPAIGTQFRADYVAVRDGAPVKNIQARYPTTILAAAAATADDVDRAEVAARKLGDQGAVSVYSTDVMFLMNVVDERLAGRVLNDAMHERALSMGAPLAFLFALGQRHPEIAYAYLRAHIAELKSTLPPTQQAWTISTGVARSLWRAGEPAELRRFLDTEFPAEPQIVRQATATLESRWRQRHALQAALQSFHPSPDASARGADVSR